MRMMRDVAFVELITVLGWTTAYLHNQGICFQDCGNIKID